MTVPAARRRWWLHPAAVAVALVLAGALGVVAVLRPGSAAWPALLLVAVAGAAAGFANSGST